MYILLYHSSIFFGDLVSREGVRPDPRKLEAIQKLQLPKTKCELQSFLGMASYISKYTPEAVQVCKSLCELISIRCDYKWHQCHLDAFNKAKKLMNKDCYFHVYNPNKPLFIETDASKVRLGGALLQTEEKLKESEIEDDTLPMTFQLKPAAYALKISNEHRTKLFIFFLFSFFFFISFHFSVIILGDV